MPCTKFALVESEVQAIFAIAVKTIDEKFGEDYAKKNPVLLAALVNTACVKLDRLTDVYIAN